MPKVPRITGEEAVTAFRRYGFYVDRTKKHCILKKDGHPYHLSIPMHKGKTIGVGLIKSLIADAGLTVDQFIELLKQ